MYKKLKTRKININKTRAKFTICKIFHILNNMPSLLTKLAFAALVATAHGTSLRRTGSTECDAFNAGKTEEGTATPESLETAQTECCSNVVCSK